MRRYFEKLEKMALAMVIMSVTIIVASCSTGSGKTYRIGVAQCSGGYYRDRINSELQMELLNHPDVTLDIRNAQDDSQRQVEDVRYFINNGYDLIILAPNESAPLAVAVDEAKAKGIPVVTFDRRVDSDNFSAHMEIDNFELGKGVAKYIKSLGGRDWKILELRGPETASPARLRHEGFVEAISADPNLTLVESVGAEWNYAKAEYLTDSILRLHPEINLLYAHTDHMALGASEALRKLGRGDVKVIGIDGFPDQGIQAVSEGKMTATLLYPTEGQRLLQIAMAVLKGEPYERITRVAPLSPVDNSNADILLAQDNLLREETAKINLLNKKIDVQLSRYASQQMLLWAVVAIVMLLSGLIFLLLKSINNNRLHQRELEDKNSQLEDKNNQLKEEKEKQEELYSQLAEATRSKLMFFTNVSHDLRTPLTLIAGPVEQVADDASLSERNRSLMQLTKKNVVILRRLIDQILDFRKYENGKADLKLSEADFPGLLREWTEAFSEVARKRDIKLTVGTSKENTSKETETPDGKETPGEKGKLDKKEETDRKETPGESIAVDVEKMERVFFNLMSNAFKHTPDNGRIRVSYCCDGSTFSYTVSDTGSGIDKEETERIFDRFYQAEGANPKGSGIGLALTKAFIELHGGSITVKSEKGRGSEFTVTFPVHHTDSSRKVSTHISREDVETELARVDTADTFSDNKPTLLIIDDNSDIRTLIAGQLGEEYNVISAIDGLQGLRMATKYVPDIILCDVMMPVMDGLECVKALKEEVSTSHIPVLMLTACSLDEQRVAGYDHGADAYLSKPFNLAVLASRCRNLLANRKRIRELYGKTGAERKGESSASPSASSRRPSEVSRRPNDVESDFYNRFVEIVNKNMGDSDLQVSAIASQMGLGQSQFTRKIKALTNYTPVELIRSMRLQRAKTLLLGSEKTVSEIAYEVGFTSLAYFSKCYKEAFGLPPTEAREGK